MRQWILNKHARNLDDLVMVEREIPTPSAGHVRVKVLAVSLNYRDVVIMKNDVGMGAERDMVPLSDGVGIVDALGPDVKKWQLGDRVVTQLYGGWKDGTIPANIDAGLGSNDIDGTLADYIVVPQDRLVKAPQSLSDEEAATLPCAGLTAWSALNGNRPYLFTPKAGQKVLLLGTGGLSLMAVGMAKALGAEVYITTGQNNKIPELEKMGISGVFNYRENPLWGQEVFEKTQGGVDLVMNNAGLDSINQAVNALKFGGTISLVGAKEHANMAPNLLALIRKNATLFGVLTGSEAAYKDYIAFIDEKKINPPIAAVYDFAQAHEAYQQLMNADLMGKIVIRVGQN